MAETRESSIDRRCDEIETCVKVLSQWVHKLHAESGMAREGHGVFGRKKDKTCHASTTVFHWENEYARHMF